MPLLLGAVAGPALQLQQPALWALPAYVAVLAGALALLGAWIRLARVPALAHACAACGLAALAAFGLCGSRAAVFAQHALAPALEGSDVAVTGIVAAMPQRHDLGLRFRFEVEEARIGARAVRLPPLLSVGWYAGPWAASAGAFDDQRQAPALRAGERWQFTVRLRAPHGNLNPHGFDCRAVAVGAGRAGHRPRAGGQGRCGAGAAGRDLAPSGRAGPAGDARGDRAARGRPPGRRRGVGPGGRRPERDRARRLGRLPRDRGRPPDVDLRPARDDVRVGGRPARGRGMAPQSPACAWPGRRRMPRSPAAWCSPAAYALFSGWGVPAQRTLLMLACVGGAALRRPPLALARDLACSPAPPSSRSIRGPCCSRASGSASSPWACCSPPIPVGPRLPPPGGASRSALLREQLVVTLALAPLTLLLFGQVSLVGLAANLVAIPWVTLVVTPLAMAGTVLPLAWDLAAAARAGPGLAAAGAGRPAVRGVVRRCAAAVGRRGRRAGRPAAGDAPAAVLARPGRAAAAAGAALAGAAAATGRVRAAGRRRRAGQCRARAHRGPHAGLRHRARATAPRATPASACWCRCCGPWASVSTPSCSATATRTTPAAPRRCWPCNPQAALLGSLEADHPAGVAAAAAARAGPGSAGPGTAWPSRCCIRRQPTTAGAARPNARQLRAAGRHRDAGRLAGRRHRAAAGSRAAGPRGAAARERAAGAAPRQPHLLERRLPRCGAAPMGRWSRRATATASAIRRPRSWRATWNAGWAWPALPSAARRPGRPREPGAMRCERSPRAALLAPSFAPQLRRP